MLKIANYKNSGNGGSNKPKYKLVVTATDDSLHSIEELFEGHRIGFDVKDRTLTLRRDPESPYRLGKFEPKPGRRVIGILHNIKSLGTFGSVEVAGSKWDDTSVALELPEELAEPVKKTKPRKKRDTGAPVTISLREAVRAVNHHKAELKGDLCLSIDSRGQLRALIEY